MDDGYYDPVADKIMKRASTLPAALESPKDPHITTTLNVGGLDESVTEDEVRDHFHAYGEIRQITMVPKQGCAFVQYRRRSAAEVTFEKTFDRLGIRGRRLTIGWGRSQGEQQYGGQLERSQMKSGHGAVDRDDRHGSRNDDDRGGGYNRRDDRNSAGDIFGGAKPVDTAKKEQENEEKLKSAAPVPPSPTPMPAEPAKKPTAASIFGGAKPVDKAAKERKIEPKLSKEQQQQQKARDLQEKLDDSDLLIGKLSIDLRKCELGLERTKKELRVATDAHKKELDSSREALASSEERIRSLAAELREERDRRVRAEQELAELKGVGTVESPHTGNG